MAAKTNEEILEAVKSLEPGNDEHWTTDGFPRLDAVENLLGASVARKQVTNAAPNFNRGHSQSLVDAVHDEETAGLTDDDPDADAPDPDADPLSLGDLDEADKETAAGGDTDQDPLAEGPGDQENELDQAVQEAQDQVDRIRRYLEQGKVALDEAERELGAAHGAKNSAFPPISPAEAIQQFQQNELQKRADARGVPLTSPLDAALKARRNASRKAPDFTSKG